MAQKSFPLLNRTGVCMHWPSCWSTNNSYKNFLNKDIFLKKFLLYFFFAKVSSSNIFFSRRSFIKNILHSNKLSIKYSHIVEDSSLLKRDIIVKVKPLFLGKIWLIAYSGFIVLCVYIYRPKVKKSSFKLKKKNSRRNKFRKRIRFKKRHKTRFFRKKRRKFRRLRRIYSKKFRLKKYAKIRKRKKRFLIKNRLKKFFKFAIKNFNSYKNRILKYKLKFLKKKKSKLYRYHRVMNRFIIKKRRFKQKLYFNLPIHFKSKKYLLCFISKFNSSVRTIRKRVTKSRRFKRRRKLKRRILHKSISFNFKY